ncbi:bile acid:sodium symporter family protein [Sinosporangium siamense]|uniref:Transporter n=1 Tax=Sinosporangium siamense TaxID=1367973 RepID=A0A919RP06_9ACTN|nr:bile acid:sodium symporter family protein [Sinosporangium siamense]GII95984.1 transporter [Sinosporangium siamense]
MPAVLGVFLPAALAIIMFGLGLGLALDDFRRVAVHPKAAILALICQIVILPLICFGLVLLFGLAPGLAVGMMLLAASPGGTTANLYSHLFGGDVALNIALTAVNSVIAVVTLPLVTNFAVGYFYQGGNAVGLQLDKTVQVFAIVLVPVALGMFVKARAPRFAARMDNPVRIASGVILFAVVATAIYQDRHNMIGYIAAVGVITLLFSVVSLAVGYWVPRLGGVDRRQAIASCMEIGIHNSTLAITIGLSPTLLNNREMAIPAAVYGILMFFTAAAAGLLVRRSAAGREETAAAT